MRKVLMIAALAATAILLDSGMASARSRKCGGGGRHGGCHSGRRGHHGGGGCASGGCASGGCGGGYAYGGGGFAGGYALLDAATADQSATVVVELPADATLTIDGEATTSTSATRVFRTPELEPGQTFHYTFKAQVERDGKVQSVTRRVEVRAGQQTQVSLTLPTATVAAQ
ncbi:MAG TPA: TIGR03000 domain-containing protein [Gemmataceae bacterium]|jgi:uncharacterized protein (TIGR03000 family)|nr:TIGR03000 domain-containing protein [Gemmataceae bacterium]